MLTPVYQDWSGGGGVSQVRGSDPKGVNVTAVVWISDFYVICFQVGAGGGR